MSTFPLGKLPAQPARPQLKLSAALAERLAAPPASCDWQSDSITWPMYANDQIGDCTCAGVGHLVNQLTFYGSGAEQQPAETSVVAMYSAITGYTPAKPSSDTGAYCQDVLGYWRKTGLEGHKIVAYASLDVSNLTEIKQAISLFGTVYVGLNFPDSAMDQFNAGQVWDAKRGARIEGGHCVIVGAYGNKKFGLVTWGAETEMTEAFWKKYVDEAWVVLDADGLNKAAAYFTGAASFYALGEQFAALTGETNPVPQPTPTPVPTPPPSPTPAPDPRLAKAALAAQQLAELMQPWAPSSKPGGTR
ncbi:hypothetical protein ABT215_12860 [Streptomyces sp900105755]|uniref:hypothetical protein n=1 Tax=Streptomyces sp. 900105755 TaxID=3154389 RepID=UPI00332F17CB